VSVAALVVTPKFRNLQAAAVHEQHVFRKMNFLKSKLYLLMRVVEKFDHSSGNKFSTYATWAIMKNFALCIFANAQFRSGPVHDQELRTE
jgi:hypothetical protein